MANEANGAGAMDDEMMLPVMLDEAEVLEVIDDGDEVSEIEHAVESGAIDMDEDEGTPAATTVEEPHEEEVAEAEAADNGELTEIMEDTSECQFTGHDGAVFSVAVHPTSELAVSGGEDDAAFLWSLKDGSKVRELAQHEDSVVCVAFNRDGKFVATGSMDGIIMVWMVEDGSKVCELDCGDDLTWFQWHPVAQFILAATGGGALYMWDVPGANQSFFSGQTMSASCGGWAPDGRNFVSGSEDGSLVLWSPKSGQIISRVNDGDGGSKWGPLTTSNWNPMGEQVAVGTAEGVVNVVQAKAGKVIASFSLGDFSVEAVALSHSAPLLLAAGTMSGEVTVFDVATQRQLHRFQHTHGVVKLVWCADRPAVFCSTLGGTTHLWNCTTGECEATYSGSTVAHVLDFVLTPDATRLVTVTEDKMCRVYNVDAARAAPATDP